MKGFVAGVRAMDIQRFSAVRARLAPGKERGSIDQFATSDHAVRLSSRPMFSVTSEVGFGVR
jgi:hypothetical protein